MAWPAPPAGNLACQGLHVCARGCVGERAGALGTNGDGCHEATHMVHTSAGMCLLTVPAETMHLNWAPFQRQPDSTDTGKPSSSCLHTHTHTHTHTCLCAYLRRALQHAEHPAGGDLQARCDGNLVIGVEGEVLGVLVVPLNCFLPAHGKEGPM
eukprot:scaffold15946_cov22-Tisochrysis_lutea.AAC.1